MYLSIYVSIYLSICLSIYLSASLKQSNSARLPQFSNLTTSKTKQFCETSSIFAVDNIKNEAILRRLPSKWKVECRADGLVPMRFAIFFHFTCLNYWVIQRAAPVTQKHLSKPEDLMLQNATPLRKSAPGPLVLISMSLLLRLPRKMHLCRSSSNFPRLPSHRFWKYYKTLTFCSLLTRCAIPCACQAKPHLNVSMW